MISELHKYSDVTHCYELQQSWCLNYSLKDCAIIVKRQD